MEVALAHGDDALRERRDDRADAMKTVETAIAQFEITPDELFTAEQIAEAARNFGLIPATRKERVLPPSLTIMSSNPRATVRVRVRAMVEDSFSVGMMTEIIIGAYRSGVFGSLNMKYMTTTTVVQKTTCLCQKSTSP